MIAPLASYYARSRGSHYESTEDFIENNAKEYSFAKCFDITEEQSKRLVYEYYFSDEAYNVTPIYKSQEAIEKLSINNHLYIITGRQTYDHCVAYTEKMIEQFFPDMFDDILYTNSYSLNRDPCKNKIEIMEELEARVLIDDIHETCMSCISEGKQGILFGNYSWNRDAKNIPRVYTWELF